MVKTPRSQCKGHGFDPLSGNQDANAAQCDQKNKFKIKIKIPVQTGKPEKDKYHTVSLACGIGKKKIQMKLFTKQTHRDRKQTHGYQGERGREG